MHPMAYCEETQVDALDFLVLLLDATYNYFCHARGKYRFVPPRPISPLLVYNIW